jgi:phage terminase large subunit-like protein
MLQTPVIEAGRVILPPNAAWLNVFKTEVNSFPQAAHYDQVDALVQLLDYASNMQQNSSSLINALKKRIQKRDPFSEIMNRLS